jgi:hypothetical protein
MRTRIIWVVAVVLVVTAAAVGYDAWRTAGHEQMQAVTERIAGAVARSDREALAAEPILQDHTDMIPWLLESNPAITNGYRVTVCRNGANGHYLMTPDLVTHLGEIEANGAQLTLGFRYDRETKQLVFVTASRVSLT